MNQIKNTPALIPRHIPAISPPAGAFSQTPLVVGSPALSILLLSRCQTTTVAVFRLMWTPKYIQTHGLVGGFKYGGVLNHGGTPTSSKMGSMVLGYACFNEDTSMYYFFPPHWLRWQIFFWWGQITNQRNVWNVETNQVHARCVHMCSICIALSRNGECPKEDEKRKSMEKITENDNTNNQPLHFGAYLGHAQ